MLYLKAFLKFFSSITSFFETKQKLDAGRAIEKSETQAKELEANENAKKIDDSIDAMSDDDVLKQLQERIPR